MMSRDYQKLLKLIEEEATSNEICEELKIDKATLAKKLKHLDCKGYSFIRQFDSDGCIDYRFNKNLNVRHDMPYGDLRLKLNPNASLRFVAISDLHLGNFEQRLDLLDKVFDYCAKEDIHVIMSCGDLIDGTYSKSPQLLTDPNKQIEYFIKTYPSDKDIVTYGVGGDHEYSILDNYYLDPIKIITTERQDIMIPNYRDTYINVNASQIRLNHNIAKLKGESMKKPDLNLLGHFHKYVTREEDGKAYIFVPTLTEMTDYIPSALDIEVNFDKTGRMNLVESSELLLEPKVRKLGVNKFNIKHEQTK